MEQYKRAIFPLCAGREYYVKARYQQGHFDKVFWPPKGRARMHATKDFLRWHQAQLLYDKIARCKKCEGEVEVVGFTYRCKRCKVVVYEGAA